MKPQDQCYDASDMWKRIHAQRFPANPADCIEDFKSGDVNFKIAVWDPRTSGLRYLKALIFNLCAGLAPDNWTRLAHIRNRSVGNPTTIRYRNEDVCMDYLQAVLELEFIAKQVNLDAADVLEIGGGYGRTCHAILSNHRLASYTIVDLPPCLALSRAYLGRVLEPDQFARLRFCPVDEFPTLVKPQWTLCMNIDSFAEMDENVVRSYLRAIDTSCDWLYVKNPVGKYLDKSLDNHTDGNEAVTLALRTGLLRTVIDIHDSECINRQAEQFPAAYQPGTDWECISNTWSPPWSYYWQALYRRNVR